MLLARPARLPLAFPFGLMARRAIYITHTHAIDGCVDGADVNG